MTIAAGALCALAAAPSLASAAPTDARSGRFRVELEGVQRTTWETRHAPQFACDVAIEGSGTETVAFRSPPTIVDVSAFGRTVVLRRGRGPATIDLAATITRRGELTETGGEICSDGDGTGGQPQAPDCGRRRSQLAVDLRHSGGRRALVTVEPSLAAPLDTFAACPEGGTSWPSLLTRDDRGRAIGQRLPAADLFEHGKSIVVARGRETYLDLDTTATTTIRWALSFTRIDAG